VSHPSREVSAGLRRRETAAQETAAQETAAQETAAQETAAAVSLRRETAAQALLSRRWSALSRLHFLQPRSNVLLVWLLRVTNRKGLLVRRGLRRAKRSSSCGPGNPLPRSQRVVGCCFGIANQMLHGIHFIHVSHMM